MYHTGIVDSGNCSWSVFCPVYAGREKEQKKKVLLHTCTLAHSISVVLLGGEFHTACTVYMYIVG